MTNIATYYDLLFKLEINEQKINWLSKDVKFSDDLAREQQQNTALKENLENLKKTLDKYNESADLIRTGFIRITNRILQHLEKIETWGSYYPDLNQGMIIPGYLFLSILHDYKTNLLTEGSYAPVAEIYMSQKEWPVQDLKQILLTITQDLDHFRFSNLMNAITYYNRIKDLVFKEIHVLKELKYI